MSFSFRLQRVLNYKKMIEDMKKNQYGIAQKELYNEEDKLNYFNKHKWEMFGEKDLLAAKTKAGNLAMYNNHIEAIKVKIKKQEQIVEKAEKELNEIKKKMMIAVKEKKTLEKLKENDYEKYSEEIKKQEHNETDTVVNYKMSTQL